MAETTEFNEIDWKTQEQEDDANLQKLLAESQQDGAGALFDMNRPLETGEKADDAEDFEDISDDDLPEEEEAAGAGDGDVPGLTDDMGTSHDTDDLFGDGRGSSPFDEFDDHDPFQPNGVPQPNIVNAGLTLPSPEEEEEIDLRELNFPEHPRTTNQDPSIPAPAESEEELLKQSWPGFQRGTILNWNQLLPPKPRHIIPKAPEKLPRPVNPTKASLDLAPDEEKSFRNAGPATSNKRKRVQEAEAKGLVAIEDESSAEEDNEEALDYSIPSPIGGVSWTDLEILCGDWESKIDQLRPQPIEQPEELDEWEREMYEGQPTKRRKVVPAERDIINAPRFPAPSFDNFEAATKKSAKRVLLDLNDPHLLLDTLEYSPVKRQRLNATAKASKGGFASSFRSRFNISNDEAYDALKENHQSKVRATLGNVALEHSMPALRLQWPYYLCRLLVNDARSFHRPSIRLEKLLNQPNHFSKPAMRKKKQVKNMPTQEVFKECKDLSLADHYSSATLLEYSEEHPIILSNFGMGNRIINYYRRRDADDSERPQPEDKVGDVTPLLPEDKSPFANFGEVDPGETVRTIHNSMYKAPIFKHETKSTDFLMIRETTGIGGSHWYVRNIDHVFAVGQQFPSMEIPGPHSRRVTNATKTRMRMIALRKMKHSPTHSLRIQEITEHIKDSQDSQNRQKMKEFFDYDKTDKVWKMRENEQIPDESVIRSFIKPEEVCALQAMEVGTRQLQDAGYEVEDEKKTAGGDKQPQEDVDEPADEGQLEKSLTPWRTSRAFLDASQGKAMLMLHGGGDPSGNGLAISMVRTSMKGGYLGALQGPSSTSQLQQERKANGGHGYNVKKQEEKYQSAIREIWDKQKANLSDPTEYEENEDEKREQIEEDARLAASQTPHSMQTPGPYDDSASMVSGHSTLNHSGKALRITRKVINPTTGIVEEVVELIRDKRVWREYLKRVHERDSKSTNIYNIKPTGQNTWDAAEKLRMQKELLRLERNKERRQARERQKSNQLKKAEKASNEPDVASPSATATPIPLINEKAAGTTRKCNNCGQAGHIKTNKKYCPMSPDYAP
ncbi:hypothetical protein HYFRA_00012347 [Hymenoscyphus fraxineus]|uniref:Transcription initiation factor TFIID subunit 1 histone acetyltransferase domain-containing protein n=1 Tax=Hymenoscyphus fraxineus TaxID=746836 RepID=A0A9N9L4J4_9HELO|nr:hypothetical protein HYFRA_00012347 [Hymenoscyphus fraxineus]